MRSLSRILAALMFAGTLAAIAWAGTPWKTKPYQQWNKNDVMQVLEHSPWVQSFTVPVSWHPLPMYNSPAAAASLGGSASVDAGGGPGGGSPSLGMRPQEPHATFVARWISAKTIREAVARRQVLAGEIPEARADSDVAKQPSDYEIMVLGSDMTPFADLTPAELTKDSYLHLRSAKKELEPSSVNIYRSLNGKQVLGVTFHFARTAANGQPMIGPSENEVDLVCRLKKTRLDFRFHPRDMAGRSGTDL